MGPSRAVQCNCLAWCVGNFSQLLKCFAIDGFTTVFFCLGVPDTTVGAFLLFDGRFTVVLLERSFVEEKSGTSLALV